MNLVFLVLFH